MSIKRISTILIQTLSFLLFMVGLIMYDQHSSENLTKAFLIVGSFLMSVYLIFFHRDKDDFATKLFSGLISANSLLFVYSIPTGLFVYIILLSALMVYSYWKTKKEQVIEGN